MGIYAANGNKSHSSAMAKAKDIAELICIENGRERLISYKIEKPDREHSRSDPNELFYVVPNQEASGLSVKLLPLKKKFRINNPIGAIITSFIAYEKNTIEIYHKFHYEFVELICR